MKDLIGQKRNISFSQPDFARFCQILPDLARSCQILPDLPRSGIQHSETILQLLNWGTRNLHDPARSDKTSDLRESGKARDLAGSGGIWISFALQFDQALIFIH
jgi:hypothetical protein